MNLLGFESSSALGSVALATPRGLLVREIATPREQTERMLALTDELLTKAGITLEQLDGIAFGRGPGSFTGLRVSVAVAQGLAAVTAVPLLPVSSLACLAQRAYREHRCERGIACVDAHMGEVYSAEFAVQDGAALIVGAERLGPPADVAALRGEGWCAVGNGFAAHAAALAATARAAARVLPELVPAAEDLFPQARSDLAAGRGAAATAALPLYLREHTAWRRSS
jgi:tRNA threonylcarbamoyladenosine biosynthesis protein TsaB